MDGYCERHHQPWDIKCINGQWVCECPKCRAEGLLDTYVDTKVVQLSKEQWTANNRTMDLDYIEISEEDAEYLVCFIRSHERENIPDEVWDICIRMMKMLDIC